MQKALNSFTIPCIHPHTIYEIICDNVGIQEVLSQAFGCLKALIWAFSLNEVFHMPVWKSEAK